MFSWNQEEEEKELVSWLTEKGIVCKKGEKGFILDYKWWLEWYPFLHLGPTTLISNTASASKSRNAIFKITIRPKPSADSPSKNQQSLSTKPKSPPQVKSRTIA